MILRIKKSLGVGSKRKVIFKKSEKVIFYDLDD